MTERTAKRYKVMYVAGVLMVLVGATAFTAGVNFSENSFDSADSNGSVGLLALGLVVFLLGFPLILVARFLAWWHHG